jgi:hypothetical protein
MITLIHTPTEKQTLMLRRAPYFLRVVWNDKGEVDALDQIEDEPRKDERVMVYVRNPVSMQRGVHLNTGGKKGGGWFAMASYRVSYLQPPDEVMRHNGLWAEWATRHGTEALRSYPIPLEWLDEGWLPMWAGPKDCTSVTVRTAEQIYPDAHFAQDLSGEEQPPFSGWFYPVGNGFRKIEKPRAWRPLTK